MNRSADESPGGAMDMQANEWPSPLEALEPRALALRASAGDLTTHFSSPGTFREAAGWERDAVIRVASVRDGSPHARLLMCCQEIHTALIPQALVLAARLM